MAPVLVSRLKPAGSAPALTDQTKGEVPPLRATLVEYAVPVDPSGSEVVVIVSAAATVIDNAFVVDAPALSIT